MERATRRGGGDVQRMPGVDISHSGGGSTLSYSTPEPLPQAHLTRYHGVFASNCRLRTRVVPSPSGTAVRKRHQCNVREASSVPALNDEDPSIAPMTWAESLGAKFVETGVVAEGTGGYARELTAEEKAKQQEVLDARIAAVVADRVPDDCSLIVNIGTTTEAVAREIAKRVKRAQGSGKVPDNS